MILHAMISLQQLNHQNLLHFPSVDIVTNCIISDTVAEEYYGAPPPIKHPRVELEPDALQFQS